MQFLEKGYLGNTSRVERSVSSASAALFNTDSICHITKITFELVATCNDFSICSTNVVDFLA